jgi:hypothetical protein
MLLLENMLLLNLDMFFGDAYYFGPRVLQLDLAGD